MNVGRAIRSMREKLGLSQKEMADKLGITPSMVCQIERGTKIPSLYLSVEIADVLQCSLETLVSSAKD